MQVEFKVLERAQEKTVKLKEIRETILWNFQSFFPQIDKMHRQMPILVSQYILEVDLIQKQLRLKKEEIRHQVSKQLIFAFQAKETTFA